MIDPYRNEEESVAIGDLTIENRLDRIELYGSLAITRDQAGLEIALRLKDLLDRTVDALTREKLPERIATVPVERIDNPFAD